MSAIPARPCSGLSQSPGARDARACAARAGAKCQNLATRLEDSIHLARVKVLPRACECSRLALPRSEHNAKVQPTRRSLESCNSDSARASLATYDSCPLLRERYYWHATPGRGSLNRFILHGPFERCIWVWGAPTRHGARGWSTSWSALRPLPGRPSSPIT